MFLLMGERVRAKSDTVGCHTCPVCKSGQKFTDQVETLWFTLFGLPVLPLEQCAHYWRCEQCHTAFKPRELRQPSAVPILKDVVVYLLLGYDQQVQTQLAGEICARVTGFEFPETEVRALGREIASGRLGVAEVVRRHASSLNAAGKQQVIEGAFLTTYACCDIRHEDRVRINQIGSALDVGLEFVTWAIEQARRQRNYGIRRLGHVQAEV